MDCFFKAIFGTWGKTCVKRIQVNIVNQRFPGPKNCIIKTEEFKVISLNY